MLYLILNFYLDVQTFDVPKLIQRDRQCCLDSIRVRLSCVFAASILTELPVDEGSMATIEN